MIRAKRRAELVKQKRRARKLFPWCENPAKYADHLASCSCWMCGNPRKYFGLKTIQELKALMKFEE
jgi:hypothetical protein